MSYLLLKQADKAEKGSGIVSPIEQLGEAADTHDGRVKQIVIRGLRILGR